MRWNKSSAIVAACCAALIAGVLPAASAQDGEQPGSDSVQIRRTEYGIPHILAQDYSGLGYGYGYAFAQDNACAMADRVLTLRGERSRYLGGAAMNNDSLNGPDTNADSDTYFQALRRSGTVPRMLARPAPSGPTPQLRQLVDGYVAGFNRYLREVGVAHLPDPSCQGKPWVQPITAEDVWLGVLDLDQSAGQAGFRHEIVGAVPPAAAGTTAAGSPATTTDATAKATAKATAAALTPALSARRSEDRGSNGWAVGADAIAGHDGGLLLANPHLPWTGDSRFYQVQLTIPGVLDVSGASLYGTPVVEIGHTRGLAWTHTATDSNHMSLYQLQLVPGDPTSYLVDGRAEPMRRQQVPVEVLGADGTVSTVTRTLYSSRYGPVLADGWTGTSAVSLRDANADNIRSMNQWLAMGRAQTVPQLRAAQQTYQGSPWVYTIATDTSGAAYFTDSSATPHLTDAQLAACTLAPLPGDQAPPLLDGASTACDWGTDPDAIGPGLFGPAADPTLLRRDYVANSNNSPALANPAAPLTGYPQVFGDAGPLEPRPQEGLAMIAARIAGTDGLPGPAGFTLPALQQLMFSDGDLTADTGVADVLAMCRAHPTLTAGDGAVVDVRPACAALAGWDRHGGVDSHGQVLWGLFVVDLTRTQPAGTWWRVPYDPRQPLTTPRGINGDLPSVQTVFADVVRLMAAGGVPVDAAPGQMRRWDGVPLPGCSSPEGCFNVVSGSPTSGQNGGIDASGPNRAVGSSFVMAVRMTAAGPKAATVLTYSESTNPASPHYTDQSELFSHSQWVTERFSAAEIGASPALQVTTLHR
ncbi:MAG: hypothetical protein HOW97_33795 [Catenulispora sp.]|nr:hypothetical protein [Catenulispora sp.]